MVYGIAELLKFLVFRISIEDGIVHSKLGQHVDTFTVSPVNVSISCLHLLCLGLNLFVVEYRCVAGDKLMNKR